MSEMLDDPEWQVLRSDTGIADALSYEMMRQLRAPIKAIEFHATITSKRTLECIGGDLSAKLQQSSGIAHVSQPPELTK